MNLTYILNWLALFVIIINLFQISRWRGVIPSSWYKVLLTSFGLWLGLFLKMGTAGGFFIFIFVSLIFSWPYRVYRKVLLSGLAMNSAETVKLWRRLAVLHPFSWVRDELWLARWRDSVEQGDIVTLNHLAKTAPESQEIRAKARLCELIHRGEASEARRYLLSLPSDLDLGIWPMVVYGELSDFEGMNLHLQRQAEDPRLIRSQRILCLVFVALAYLGRRADVKRLLNGPFSELSAVGQKYWWHLTLKQKGAECQSLERTCETHLRHYGFRSKEVVFKTTKTWATRLLLGLTLGMFFLSEILGGSEHLGVLLVMGAVVPELVLNGEVWRLLSANFLHFGLLHLGMNALALYYLGQFVERLLGSFRFLFLTVMSGVLAMGSMVLVYVFYQQETFVLVGGSAIVMALVGGIGVWYLRHWLKTRSLVAKEKLQLIALILGLQFVFDISTPQVAGGAHILGCLYGALSMLLFLLWDQRTMKSKNVSG